MGIKIIADSLSDIRQQEAKALDILILPLTVRFGESEYTDGITLDPQTFYEKLTSEKELPKTSQIAPFTYQQAFEEALQAGDQVLCITGSSGVSGCFQSARLAAEEVRRKAGDPEDFREQLVIIDSKQATASEYVLVQYAVSLRNEGMEFLPLVETVKAAAKKVRLIALLDTLEYLKKGGRISGTAAAVGSLLAIKPLVTFENGVVEIIGKARGYKNAHAHLLQMLSHYGGIDFSKPFVAGFAGTDDSLLRQHVADSPDIFGEDYGSVPVTRVGPTIGTYTGPGTVVFGFFTDEE